MDEKQWKRYESLVSQLWMDPEYQELERQRMRLQKGFAQAMSTLDESQWEVIWGYWDLCAQLNWRAVELACWTL